MGGKNVGAALLTVQVRQSRSTDLKGGRGPSGPARQAVSCVTFPTEWALSSVVRLQAGGARPALQAPAYRFGRGLASAFGQRHVPHQTLAKEFVSV